MPPRFRWLTDVIPLHVLGEQLSIARSIEVIERPPAEMCLACRGERMLCGKPKCPIILNAQSLIKHGRSLDSEHIQGSTPPGIFVGRFGYPKVYIGPMVPPYHGDTEVLDTPEWWLGRSIEEIVDYRSSLVRGSARANVLDVQKGGKLLGLLQEMAMAAKPVDLEVQLTRRPRRAVTLSEDSQPFGPSAPLKSFKSANPSVDRRVERAYCDGDLKAADAVLELYRAGVLVTRIQRAFSAGMFGVRSTRRLVPTRWSITAVDSAVSLALIEEIKQYPTIDEYRVYSFKNLDNIFVAILMPEPFKFEWIEAWFPQTTWNQYGSTPAMMGDYEGYFGRTKYARVGGCYYAVRLAVTEALSREGRQAAALLLREIHPGYILPVGVWNVRESVRAALKAEPAKFDSLQGALGHSSKKLTIPLRQWVESSVLLKTALFQRKITSFF